MNSNEDLAESCRSMVHFVGKHADDDDQSVRDALLRDLCWKAQRVDPFDRAKVLAEVGYELLPRAVRSTFSSGRMRMDELRALRSGHKRKKDIGIVTALGKEMRMLLLALGRPDGLDREDERIGNFNYWYADVDRGGRPKLSVVTTMVGRPRNVPCAIAVDHLLRTFDVDLMLMVGIAAGPKDKVKLGDVVYGEGVYDYEHKRLELRDIIGKVLRKKVELPRPLWIDIEDVVRFALQRFEGKPMAETFAALLREIDSAQLPATEVGQPSVRNGTIGAGEKLIADGSLPRMRKIVDERIRAVDQEDSGFAQACKANGMPWCVFRGICDYGDPGKGDKWHAVASLAASVAAVSFLRTAW